MFEESLLLGKPLLEVLNNEVTFVEEKSPTALA